MPEQAGVCRLFRLLHPGVAAYNSAMTCTLPHPRAFLRRLGVALIAAPLLWLAPAAVQASPDPDLVRALVLDAVAERAADMPGQLEVDVSLRNLDRFADCHSLHAEIPARQRLRARMSVAVRCDAPDRWQTYAQVQLRLQGEYLVAARTIEQGEGLTPDRLESRHGDLLGLPRGVILQPEIALGQIAERRIAAGQLLRQNALRSPNSIQRGQAVRVEVRGSGFVASGEGEAMADASPGSPLQVRTASGQIVRGMVRADGVVEISQ